VWVVLISFFVFSCQNRIFGICEHILLSVVCTRSRLHINTWLWFYVYVCGCTTGLFHFPKRARAFTCKYGVGLCVCMCVYELICVRKQAFKCGLVNACVFTSILVYTF